MKKALFVLVMLAVFAPAMVFAQNARWAEVNVAYYTTFERKSMSVYVSATSEIHAEGLAIVEFEKKYGGKADRAIFIRWLTQAEYTQIQNQAQERERQRKEAEAQAQRQKEEQEKERERQAQEEKRRQAQEFEKLAGQKANYYGTWTGETDDWHRQTITITENELRLTSNWNYDSRPIYWYMKIDSWTARKNPTGYTLNGSVVGKNLWGMLPPVHIYLVDNGKSLRLDFSGVVGGSVLDPDIVFSKQK
jgi:hypothetical protein